jgi:predicted O-methyltransferase YrrM
MPAVPDASPTFADALSRIEGVEGWLSTDQAERLWNAASPLGAGAVLVEIGSFRGRSAVVLSTAAGEGTTLYAIDPHAGNDRGDLRGEGRTQEEEAEIDHKAFNANLEAAGVRDRVVHIRKFSHDAVDDVPDSIDLLYVDGAHQYTPAVGDIRAFGAKVKPGGTMLVHDSFSSVGVTLAILTDLTFTTAWRYVGRSRSLAEYRKEPVRGVGIVFNALRQLTQLPWFVRNLGIKVLLKFGRRDLAEQVFGHIEDALPY